MIYIKAGLYAEGPSDYRFLMPVITRLLQEIAPAALLSLPEIADTIGIDAPAPAPQHRADRIAAAVHDYWGDCTLFVVHGDANGDHVRALNERVLPGIAQVLSQHADAAIVPCMPVRAVEAWMLCDPGVFRQLLGQVPTLPDNPESIAEPKPVLAKIFDELGADSRALRDYQAFFGANVDFAALRALASFRAFEQGLQGALRTLCR
jgi:hypothetical protein